MTEKPHKSPTPKTDGVDYSNTLYLPQTDFPMRAGLPQREPEILARWNEIGLYEKTARKREGPRQVRAA